MVDSRRYGNLHRPGDQRSAGIVTDGAEVQLSVGRIRGMARKHGYLYPEGEFLRDY